MPRPAVRPPTARPRRRALPVGVAAVAVVLGLLVWQLVPAGGAGRPAGTVTITTGMADGVYTRYGTMLRPDIEAAMPGSRVRLLGSRGSVQNLARVRDGTAEFTIATVDAVRQLPAGQRRGLRAVARLYDDYIQLVVPAGSDIRGVADLRGKRVAVGQHGSGVYPAADLAMRAAGLDPARDVRRRLTGIDAAPELLRTGGIDAFFWSGGLPTAAVTRLAERFPVRLVPLGDLAARMQQLTGVDRATAVYRPAVMPADAYPQARPRARPVSTIAVANLMITREGVDDGLVERVTRTVIDNRDQIGQVVHAAQLVDLRTAIYTAPLPLHEGARRYYSSVKP